MKMKIKKLALIISGILLLPAAGHAHTETELAEYMQLGMTKGLIDASCFYFEKNIITKDEAAIGIGAAFKTLEENRGTKAAYKVAEMTHKKFPTCGFVFPEKFRY